MKKTICIMLVILMLLPLLIGTVSADDSEPEEELSEFYSDVYLSDPYCEAVTYLYHQGVMMGTLNPNTELLEFLPNDSLTRAQAVTILWRMAGCPEPEGTTINFIDCPSNAYYYNAVQWASSSNVQITVGTSPTQFSPLNDVSYQQILTFMYRFMIYCDYIEDDPYYYTIFYYSNLINKNSFNSYSYNPAGWAISTGVLTDMSIVPTAACIRSCAAEYFYRLYQIYQEKYGLCVVNTYNLLYIPYASFGMHSVFNHYGAATQEKIDITKTQFTAAMESQFSNAKTLDICYIYLASHGSRDGLLLFPNGSTNEILTPAYLRSQIDNYSGTFVVFIFGCYSGTYITRNGAENEDSDDAEVFDAGAFIEGLMEATDSGELGGVNRIKVLCSSEKDKLSYESSIIYRATHFWCYGAGYSIQGTGFYYPRADLSPYGNCDGSVSLTEMYHYSHDELMNLQQYENEGEIVCSAPDDLFIIYR